MGDRLTERAVQLAAVEGCLAMSERVSGDDTGNAMHGMDMRLGDIGLQREGEHGNEHDETGRGTDAPDSRVSRCGSLHKSRNRQNSPSVWSIGYHSAIRRTLDRDPF